MQDPTIRLFGKKIPLAFGWNSPPISGDDVMNSVEKAPSKDSSQETEQDPSEETAATNEPEDEDRQKETNPEISESVDPKTPSIDEDTATGKASKAAKDQSDSPNSSPEKEKGLKKPDKILTCPRCNSMDTKFCYYNNYNVNQPRHFCKACQRYWTAGGTMRNVPVGAGRRKSKSSSSASRYRHLNIPEVFQVTHGVNHHHHQYPDPRTHGTVLSFGSESCDPIAMNHKNGEDCSSESTVTTISHPVDELGSRNFQNLNGLNVPTVPWPYNMAVPFYPGPAFWTCNGPAPWNLLCLSSPSQNSQRFGPSSPVLGKHLRDGDALEPDRPKKNGSVLVPKTLRIDDPSEAAKSSIWTTLGIKKDGIATKGGIFKAFNPMFEEKTRVPEPQNPAVICANPAALSRSLKFHESH